MASGGLPGKRCHPFLGDHGSTLPGRGNGAWKRVSGSRTGASDTPDKTLVERSTRAGHTVAGSIRPLWSVYHLRREIEVERRTAAWRAVGADRMSDGRQIDALALHPAWRRCRIRCRSRLRNHAGAASRHGGGHCPRHPDPSAAGAFLPVSASQTLRMHRSATVIDHKRI
jgi:hypothetical protein